MRGTGSPGRRPQTFDSGARRVRRGARPMPDRAAAPHDMRMHLILIIILLIATVACRPARRRSRVLRTIGSRPESAGEVRRLLSAAAQAALPERGVRRARVAIGATRAGATVPDGYGGRSDWTCGLGSGRVKTTGRQGALGTHPPYNMRMSCIRKISALEWSVSRLARRRCSSVSDRHRSRVQKRVRGRATCPRLPSRQSPPPHGQVRGREARRCSRAAHEVWSGPLPHFRAATVLSRAPAVRPPLVRSAPPHGRCTGAAGGKACLGPF